MTLNHQCICLICCLSPLQTCFFSGVKPLIQLNPAALLNMVKYISWSLIHDLKTMGDCDYMLWSLVEIKASPPNMII